MTGLIRFQTEGFRRLANFPNSSRSTGIVVFAGDATPIDVISHLPIYCEDKNVPYIYVPLKHDISQAMGVYRPCLAVLIKRDDEYGELFDECAEAFNNTEIVL